MKFHDLAMFKKKIESEPPSVALLVAKESALLLGKVAPAGTLSFVASTFSASRFSAEVETLPFFEKRRYVSLEGFDELAASDQQLVTQYALAPNARTTLFITATTLGASHKLTKEAEKNGALLFLAEEKPWDKEKRLMQFASTLAATYGVELGAVEAKTIVNLLQKEERTIENEVKKIACFVGEKRKVTSEDLRQIFCGKEVFSSWQLAEKIIAFQFKEALEAAHSLLEEGTSLFALLAHLRQQFESFCNALALFEKGGLSGAQKAIAYLKESKMEAIRAFGLHKLQIALVEITRCELKAKNSAVEHGLLFELLLVKLCSSSSPTS